MKVKAYNNKDGTDTIEVNFLSNTPGQKYNKELFVKRQTNDKGLYIKLNGLNYEFK